MFMILIFIEQTRQDEERQREKEFVLYVNCVDKFSILRLYLLIYKSNTLIYVTQLFEIYLKLLSQIAVNMLMNMNFG
jgi:hypothetical protein